MRLARKPLCRLENWQYHEQNDPQYHRDHVLSGNPYGHPRLMDGESITTSRILGKRGSLVETQNTLYDLGRWSGKGLGRAELLARLGEVAV
jgi:hypothetical protein